MTSTPSSDHEALRAVAKDAWDVLVLGAGPAGALAALEMARAGARVVLVERKRFPRQKVCGACLNQTALAVLERSGLGGLVDRLGGVTLAGLRVRLEGRDATFRLPASKALARDVLDA